MVCVCECVCPLCPYRHMCTGGGSDLQNLDLCVCVWGGGGCRVARVFDSQPKGTGFNPL